jgi:hypothetical protein
LAARRVVAADNRQQSKEENRQRPGQGRDRCFKEGKPRWDVVVDARGYVSLNPSVWLRQGCKSHFGVRSGKIICCD